MVDYKQAELFAYLSEQAYKNDGGIPPAGWKVLVKADDVDIDKAGYFGIAYQNITTK